MIDFGNHEPICGLCKGRLEGPANPEPQDTFSCASCGNSDTLENITRIVGEFYFESIGKAGDLAVSETAEGSKVFKYKSNFKPQAATDSSLI